MWLEIVFSAGLILLTIAVAMKLFRSKIYNILIVHLTSQWYVILEFKKSIPEMMMMKKSCIQKNRYAEVIALLGNNKKVLDVGIGIITVICYTYLYPLVKKIHLGTGQALIKNKSALIASNITVDGVDYDSDYVKECRMHIKNEGLQNYITVCHKSILDYSDGPYDAIYFSASLMILPNPVHALNHVKSMLSENGRIFVTQTIETNRSFLIELVKPLLKYIVTIDFGYVTYEDDLLAAFKEANLKVQINKPISGTSIGDTRSFRLFVLESI